MKIIKAIGRKMTLIALRARARRLYLEAMPPDNLDCGRHLAEYMLPRLTVARLEFSKVWAQVREMDPKAPADPFGGIEE